MLPVISSGESIYWTPLQVFANGGGSHPTITDLDLGADKVDPNNEKIQNLELGADRNHQKTQTQDKIINALKLLTFREQHILVQFWSPHVVGKHQYLTTADQPFGLGVIDGGGLCSYRKDSEHQLFAVDKDLEEEISSPAARVFIRGLPEWTPNLDSYTPKHFPQQELAIRCHLHGYLALPVFDTTNGFGAGVLELLTSSVYESYAYEVHQLHYALEIVDLRTHQAFDYATLNVPNDCRQNDFDRIYAILKMVCDIHSLPLAQTWAVSQQTSFVSHEKVIEKSCSSFDTRCVGKVCMSTAALPFHVQDLGMWPFFEATRKRHLDRSRAFVGKALLSCGSCFCGDVTKLSEEEHPLVYNAHMDGWTSCFAIFLRSVEVNDEYVLEFFLPPDVKDTRHIHILNLVQTLKQNIDMASGFELGDSSCIQVVGPPAEVGISDPGTIQISSNQWPSKQIDSDIFSHIIASTETWTGDDFTPHNLNAVGARKNNKMICYPNVSMQIMNDTRGKNNRVKQRIKPKIDSLTMEAVLKHVGRPIGQAAKSLGVSRSTMKRFCREHDMPSWPLPKHIKNTVHITNLNLTQKSWRKQKLQRANMHFRLDSVVILILKLKRWSCLSNDNGCSGKWWSSGRHSYLPCKSDFIYKAACLMVQLRRWRNRSKSTTKPKHTMNNMNPYPHAADARMVTVKATFKEDILKFQFPTSSGLPGLEQQVARRIKLESRMFRLKYRDEEEDLILLACDDDLDNLLRVTTKGDTISN